MVTLSGVACYCKLQKQVVSVDKVAMEFAGRVRRRAIEKEEVRGYVEPRKQ